MALIDHEAVAEVFDGLQPHKLVIELALQTLMHNFVKGNQEILVRLDPSHYYCLLALTELDDRLLLSWQLIGCLLVVLPVFLFGSSSPAFCRAVVWLLWLLWLPILPDRHRFGLMRPSGPNRHC